MAYLLTNASRVRASQNHAEHHVWGMTKAQYIEKMKYNKTSDGIRAYERVLHDPSSIDHKFDPNCEQCEYKRRERDEYLRREEEEAEKYRIRQEEEKSKKKEKDREANERRMMAAEDKPRTPPVKVKISIEQNKEVLRLQHQKDMLMAQAQEIQAQLNKLALPKKAIDTALDRCMLCGKDENNPMYFPSKTHRIRHLESTKHKIRAGLVEKDVYPRHCDTCDYDAKTKHAWEQHCEGKKHQARTTQTVVIPMVQEVEKESSGGESPSAISPEDIVESS